MVLVDDADNVRRTNEDGMFLTDAEKESARLAKIAQEAAQKTQREEWERNAPQREVEAKQRKAAKKEARLNSFSFFPNSKRGISTLPDNWGASVSISLFTFPFMILTEVIELPSKTIDYINIQREAAYTPSTWAKPDSMIARASRQLKESSFTIGDVPLAVAAE